MRMRVINRGRRTGKTQTLICASYVTGAPIIVWNNAMKALTIKQAKALGYEIEVFTAREFREAGRYHDGAREVLIDESRDFIEEALTYYLGAHPLAITMTESCFEFPNEPDEKKPEEGVKENAKEN